MTALSIPIIRWGEPYHSLDLGELRDFRSGALLARISQANPGLIRRDLKAAEHGSAALRALGASAICELLGRAAELFANATLEVGGEAQSPEEYISLLSRSSGLPHALCRSNVGKLERALTEMRSVLRGLTRGLDPAVLGAGVGEQGGLLVSFAPTADSLSVVLPSNSPGVNSIWLPALALGTAVALRPGREEPWSPSRLLAALQEAGVPKSALGFYPSGHEGADLMLREADRGIVFGSDATTRRYARNPNIECHGTGRSKVIIGEDRVDDWRELLPLLVESVSSNGGRSCVNASCIVVPRHGEALAEALAEALNGVEPRPADDPEARLAAFADARVARWTNGVIEAGLAAGGARDLCAPLRGPRLVEFQDATYLRPSVLRCDRFDHPLANTEFLFPYVSVIELPEREVARRIGPSLVVSAITDDPGLRAALIASPGIDRLNLGAAPTTLVEWDQPHEGNLFELLYRRRAIQVVGAKP